MRLLLTIAWRNIQRHKGKSLVIGIILFLGAFVMTVGNGVIAGMDHGLKENIMNRFTGHIVIVSKSQESDNVLFIPQGKDVQVITNYKAIRAVLERQNYVDRFLPLGRGFALILNQDGDLGFCFILGVNFNDYQSMFKNNVKLVEGRFLDAADRGIMITDGSRKQIYDYQNFWVNPEGVPVNDKNLTSEALRDRNSLIIKNEIVLMGSSTENTTVDIRTPVRAIVRYEFLNDYWKMFNIIDIESFREAFHYVTAADSSVTLSADKSDILKSGNLDAMFSDDIVRNAETKSSGYAVSNYIGKKVVRKNLDIDSGAYNLIFVKIKDPEAIPEAVGRLNKALTAAKTDGRAISWEQASGQIADMASIIRGALYGFVLFIFFVAIIIIMNTLSMAAMERMSEIGMMRAVGAQRSFIGRMFFIETSFLSALFGGAGIAAGTITVIVLGTLNIGTDNRILQLLFGGNVFRPMLNAGDIVIGIIELALVSIIATLYPLVVARRITPLEAISRD